MHRALPVALVLFALAGCANDAADLRSYLHDQHQYASDYSEALTDASYKVNGGDITIKTHLYFQATAGQEVCNWASEWLYTGGRDGSIQVLNKDGDILSQRHAESDVCSFG